MLKGRVNLEYSVSEDMVFKHRALAILRPTIELSGEYTCCISSFESEDYKRKSVIVYAPASDMTMSYSKPGGGKVVVSCRAGGVYPAPDIAIFRSSPPSRRAEMEGARVTSQHFSQLGEDCLLPRSLSNDLASVEGTENSKLRQESVDVITPPSTIPVPHTLKQGRVLLGA
ncbi:hypothetical protein Pmani_010983 [Petrolisthes manimaculis]|uniref:Uncharacterized protein n=1 Tax=Petrolisthes manimaculis TaxID=1843537 RepID=A0AAE1Q3B1_9EUCA|nr:hypothetical protein Pmani_010983 [Petrolisthes manimaculis]